MTDQTVEARVVDLIAGLLGVSPDRIGRDTVAEDVPGWDSLRHAEIILAVESEFGIEFETDEIVRIDDVGSLIDLVRAREAAPGPG